MNISELQNIPTEILQIVDAEQAWHYQIIPYALSNSNSLECFINKNSNVTSTLEELELILDISLEVKPVESSEIALLLSRFYRREARGNSSSNDLDTDIDFVIQLAQEAKSLGCSDIHLEVSDKECRIRFRIDGQMIERYKIEKEEYPALINKIKIKSQLDISERRLPQDGRIQIKNEAYKIDIRVSTLPTLYGEKVVLRLLSNDAQLLNVHNLGFNKNILEDYLEAIAKPNGIVLISGPTGSGKTTTLYASLNILNTQHRNILTIEDPIEYTLDGINQVQLKEKIGLDYPKTMRAFLRQDPDIIMVGEIRDAETAQMAIRAALTGHLVLSTIHTNSAIGTIERLLDMGIPAYLIAATLNISVAQRLLRKLCDNCKQEGAISEVTSNKKYITKFKNAFKAVGCNTCFHTGYKGRTAIYEVIKIDEKMRTYIRDGALNPDEIVKEVSFDSLQDAAFQLLKNGTTSFEEAYTILGQ